MIFTSILGIVMLVGLAYLLGFRKNPDLDDASARALAEDALPGFVAAASDVDPAARTATVTGARRPRRHRPSARRPLGRAGMTARELAA